MARVLRSERSKKTIRVKWTAIILGILVVCGGLLYGVVALIGSESFEISKVEIVGAERTNAKEVGKRIEELIEGKYASLFSKRNRYIYPKSTITNELLESFPSVKTLNLSVHEEVLVVTLTEREAYALWCDENSQPLEGEGVEECVYIDEMGYAFDDAPLLDGNAFFRLSHEQTTRQVKVGTIYLPEREFERFKIYRSMLSEIELEPIHFEYRKNSEGVFVIKESDNPTVPHFVLADISTDVEQARSNITTSYQNRVFDETGGDGRQKELEYIDVRLPNKVYFRFVE